MHKFYLDGIEGEYEGVNLGRWNGWACPLFSESEAIRLMNEINSIGGGLTIGFDANNKCFMVNDTLSDDLEFYEERDSNGHKGYAIGAYNWIWQIKMRGK